ncbi:hypothetical protein CR513_21369, partial [Mucuna pruriens]
MLNSISKPFLIAKKPLLIPIVKLIPKPFSRVKKPSSIPDDNSTMQNSGVMNVVKSMQFFSSKDKNLL